METSNRPRAGKIFLIPGQTFNLCRDIHDADAAGKSYGAYMGWKADIEEQKYYEMFGRHRKQRRK